MPSVAIIGAGDLGGALTHTLARHDRIEEIWLIDEATGLAAGKALDIQQAGPIEPFHTRVRSSSDVRAAVGVTVTVVADSAAAPTTEWSGEPGIALVRALVQQDPNVVIVCAGGTQRQLIERSLIDVKISSRHLVGSAPGALVSALRALIALETNSSPTDVSLSVLGIPPDRAVIAWSSATVQGYPITDVLDPPRLARIKARVPYLWPPGPLALAAAAGRVCEAIAGGRSRPVASCFVARDDVRPTWRRVSAATVRLGPTGVQEFVAPVLNPAEQVLLDNALSLA